MTSPLQAGSCIKKSELIKNFKNYMGLDQYSKAQSFKLSLKTNQDLAYYTPESCGSAGCEYVFYILDSQDCYKKVFDFRGRFKILKEKKNGFHLISAKFKDTHLSKKTTQNYEYSLEKHHYVKKD